MNPVKRHQKSFIKIDSNKLKKLVFDIFSKQNVPDDVAEIVADTLVEANLVGHDSHGVSRVLMYTNCIKQGYIIPEAKIKVVKETPACVHVDGSWGFGPVTVYDLVKLATKKAESIGISCITSFNTNDVARLGSYVIQPAEKGLICIVMVNDGGANHCVVPHGGVEPFFCTNPIAAGIPTGKEYPIVIDMATSTAAIGKLRQAMNSGEQVPEGWLIDKNGDTTTDPNTFFNHPALSAILPLGGMLAGHKGYALSLLVEVLTGGLGGAGVCTEMEESREQNGVFVLVIDPDFFESRDNFRKKVDNMIKSLKKLKTAPGVNEILLPGERSYREREVRLREGIEIDSVTWNGISTIAEELGITMP